ncbi:MAG: hypothetical protein GXO92_07215 [FCB group bacterium]|nr:hypothetical protein [FCB group bacterium]
MEITTKKETLRTILSDYAGRRLYVNVNKARDWLKEQGLLYKPVSVKQVLNNLKRDGILYDAGRGWYATLSQPYSLNTEAISEQEKILARAFHLLPFSVWSNRQLISHYHHLPTHYVTFIYLESEALSTVRDYLLEEGFSVYMNPHATEVNKNFDIEKNPFVLRPRITEEPTDGHFATIEKILVDLFIEKDKLYLMDVWEYREIFRSVIGQFRVNMGALLRYSQRRKVKMALEELIKPFT